MKKLFIAIALAVITAMSANAQASLVQENDYESFSSVNISDDFIVNLNSSDKYSVKTISDERISPFVTCYVKNGVLYVSLDSLIEDFRFNAIKYGQIPVQHDLLSSDFIDERFYRHFSQSVFHLC